MTIQVSQTRTASFKTPSKKQMAMNPPETRGLAAQESHYDLAAQENHRKLVAPEWYRRLAASIASQAGNTGIDRRLATL